MTVLTGIPVAALLLAAATVTAPPPPLYRLRHPRPGVIGATAIVAVTFPLTVATALLLPATSVLAAAVLVCTLAVRRRRALRRRRRCDEARVLAAALETVAGELRVGAHPVRAFGTAGEECDPPVGEVMRAVAARARLGGDVAAGLRIAGAATRVPLYWERIAVCWQLAADHGLAMATLMRAAHSDIVDRQRFADRLNATLAGARATAVILAGLPPAGVLLGQLVGADPLGFLLGGGLGGWLLLTGVGLIAAGLIWSDRIIEARTQ